MSSLIGGLAVATITPFKESGEIEYSFIERQLEMLQREGADGIVPVGTNGEFPSLSMTEKKKVLEVAAAARGSMFLIAGCSSCSLPEVTELVGFSRDIGADAALIAPPYYYRDVEPGGLLDFYQRVLKSTDLPILLYNIPVYTGVAITDEIIDGLLDNRNLAGIKDTGGDPERTSELISRYPQLRVFGGSDSLAADAVASGAAGIISGAANAFPGLLKDIWEANHRGNSAREPGERVKKLRTVLKRGPWIASTKHALALCGFPQTRVRPPQMELTDIQLRELRQGLEDLGLL